MYTPLAKLKALSSSFWVVCLDINRKASNASPMPCITLSDRVTTRSRIPKADTELKCVRLRWHVCIRLDCVAHPKSGTLKYLSCIVRTQAEEDVTSIPALLNAIDNLVFVRLTMDQSWMEMSLESDRDSERALHNLQIPPFTDLAEVTGTSFLALIQRAASGIQPYHVMPRSLSVRLSD